MKEAFHEETLAFIVCVNVRKKMSGLVIRRILHFYGQSNFDFSSLKDSWKNFLKMHFLPSKDSFAREWALDPRFSSPYVNFAPSFSSLSNIGSQKNRFLPQENPRLYQACSKCCNKMLKNVEPGKSCCHLTTLTFFV